MATIGSKPPRKGRTITGKIGRTGTLSLALLVMIAIVAGLGISVAGIGQPEPADLSLPSSQNSDAEPDPALALAVSPVATQQRSTAVPTATGTQTPTPTPVPTQVSLPTQTPLPASVAQPTTEPAVAPVETIIPQSPGAPTSTPLPLPTPREAYSWTLKVPILMYHYISEPPEDADKYRLDLSTTPAAFREQMEFLVMNGFETVDLYDLSLAITDKIELPAKPIIITLDDGYRDNYENAFPILKELGLTATFFVTTEFIDQMNPNYMDWAMLEEMAAAGMRVEPHSKTHPDLTTHDREHIIWEVLGSQETIASHTGSRPRYFAYPGGRYNDEVINIVSELDFWGAVTTGSDVWHGFENRFEWGRVRMRYSTSVAELAGIIQ